MKAINTMLFTISDLKQLDKIALQAEILDSFTDGHSVFIILDEAMCLNDYNYKQGSIFEYRQIIDPNSPYFGENVMIYCNSWEDELKPVENKAEPHNSDNDIIWTKIEALETSILKLNNSIAEIKALEEKPQKNKKRGEFGNV
jgi:hypothetical protein